MKAQKKPERVTRASTDGRRGDGQSFPRTFILTPDVVEVKRVAIKSDLRPIREIVAEWWERRMTHEQERHPGC